MRRLSLASTLEPDVARRSVDWPISPAPCIGGLAEDTDEDGAAMTSASDGPRLGGSVLGERTFADGVSDRKGGAMGTGTVSGAAMLTDISIDRLLRSRAMPAARLFAPDFLESLSSAAVKLPLE